MPVVTTFNGFTMLPSDHPLYFGRIGTIGQRRANFVLQNADLVVSLGSRNNIRQISYNWENFAPKAHKIVVDIDPRELQKPTVRPNVGIAGDVGAVIEELTRRLPGTLLIAWYLGCSGVPEFVRNILFIQPSSWCVKVGSTHTTRRRLFPSIVRRMRQLRLKWYCEHCGVSDLECEEGATRVL